MQVAFGFAVFVLGFAMLIAGVGLLIGGEISFKSGKKIPKRAGRKAGIVLVGYFPLVAVALFAVRKIVADPTMPSAVVSWPLALICLGLAGIWVLRGMSPGKPKRSYTLPATASPFGEAPAASSSEPVMLEFDLPAEPAPPAGPPVGKPARSKKAEKNPFDFT